MASGKDDDDFMKDQCWGPNCLEEIHMTYCCSGVSYEYPCGCMGQPVDPFCSAECMEAYILRGQATRIAQEFHEKYEMLAPEFGYETRKESAVPWNEVPQNNRDLMIAVCESLVKSGSIKP